MKSTANNILAKAVITLLKPLLRVLIQNEVSHAEFTELARRAYVEVAYEHFSIPGRKTTYSRVAVLTGLSRKEVVRLNKLIEDAEPEVSSTPNRAIRVINGWMSDPEFLDKKNKPKHLPIQGDTGSFSALVARYSGDITLGAVIDELERIGVASRLKGDKVELTSLGYIPSEDQLEKIRIMSVCAADLLGTAVHNLNHPGDQARFQRQIDYQDVPASVVEKFELYSREKSTELIQDLNRYLSAGKRQSKAKDKTGRRVGLGIYYFEVALTRENDDEEIESD